MNSMSIDLGEGNDDNNKKNMTQLLVKREVNRNPIGVMGTTEEEKTFVMAKINQQ